MSAVLTVEGLDVRFGSRRGEITVLHGVGFELHRGRTTCVVGESGSGKSVTARSILNMTPPPLRICAGQVLFRPLGGPEVDLAATDPKGRAIRDVRGGRIAMIFQEPMSALSPVHTIGNQIVEAIRLHRSVGRREARDIAAQALERVELPEPRRMLDRYAFELSGGMRQRAMIAMALSCEPDILIADEPTTALDVTTQAEILDLIRGLQDSSGMAVMFITHDMGVVAEIAQDVVVMRHGKVVERAGVRDIFAAPKHAYTRQLLDAVRALDGPASARAVLPPPGAPLLEVRGATKRFERRTGLLGRGRAVTRAVDGVSLEVRAGEALGIVGESGSGKTTLGRMVASVYPTDAGTITFDGRPHADLDRAGLARLRREVRVIFQDPFSSLNPRMTVGRIVAEPLIANGLRPEGGVRAAVAGLLERVGLEAAMAERYPHAFSGGQRQRIVIARALALRPRLIVADEPTSALDVSIRTQVLDLLIELRREMGLSFLFISHDMAVIRYFCDRIAVMHRGRIVETGPTEDVIARPSDPYTRALLSAVPVPDPARRGLAARHRFEPERKILEGTGA